MNTQDLYEEYQQHLRKIADVKYATAVLQWDQETYMPANGAFFRAQQIATLTEMAHELFVHERFKKVLQQLLSCGDLDSDQQKNVSLTWYDFTQQEKLPGSFVRQLSEAASTCFQSWIAARQQNNFSVFQNDLAALVELKKQEAALLGYEHHPYDALLNQYERGCTTLLLDRVFEHLLPPLKALLDKIKNQSPPADDFLHQHFPKQQQWDFGMQLIQQLGFDTNAGRQDISEHPFTTNFSSKDVRVSTRIDENDFSNMTWSCIHECGHALYEQGLPESSYGLPLGEYTSLSIHESQSRLWENNVGRSYYCWQFFYPRLQQQFPEQLKKVSLELFYRGINKVTPSLIRTEADELTYHFHVLIRYRLEKALIEGSLAVNDIPRYWNEQYEAYLGVRVPDDKRGCLQDVHWSHGSFGYFPTYSLGSFYAAQFFSTAQKKLAGLHLEITNGNFQPLLNWLRTCIHQHGRRYTSEEMCEQITGETLKIDYFLEYVKMKYRNIYEIPD